MFNGPVKVPASPLPEKENLNANLLHISEEEELAKARNETGGIK